MSATGNAFRGSGICCEAPQLATQCCASCPLSGVPRLAASCAPTEKAKQKRERTNPCTKPRGTIFISSFSLTSQTGAAPRCWCWCECALGLTRKSAFNNCRQIANECRRRDPVNLMFAFQYDRSLLFERIELNLLEQ